MRKHTYLNMLFTLHCLHDKCLVVVSFRLITNATPSDTCRKGMKEANIQGFYSIGVSRPMSSASGLQAGTKQPTSLASDFQGATTPPSSLVAGLHAATRQPQSSVSVFQAAPTQPMSSVPGMQAAETATSVFWHQAYKLPRPSLTL